MSFFVSVTGAEQVGTQSELVNIFGKRRYRHVPKLIWWRRRTKSVTRYTDAYLQEEDDCRLNRIQVRTKSHSVVIVRWRKVIIKVTLSSG